MEFQQNAISLSFGVQADLVWMVKCHIFGMKSSIFCVLILFIRVRPLPPLSVLIVLLLKFPAFEIIRSLHRGKKPDEMDDPLW